jgi:hypothetical protein
MNYASPEEQGVSRRSTSNPSVIFAHVPRVPHDERPRLSVTRPISTTGTIWEKNQQKHAATIATRVPFPETRSRHS